MNVLHTRWRALVLALLLAVSLAVPAAAAETETAAEDLQTLADTAAAYAAQYGGAQSLQYALWQDGEIVLTGEAGTFSRSENRLMTGDELYGIGSVSKDLHHRGGDAAGGGRQGLSGRPGDPVSAGLQNGGRALQGHHRSDAAEPLLRHPGHRPL